MWPATCNLVVEACNRRLGTQAGLGTHLGGLGDLVSSLIRRISRVTMFGL